MKDAWPAWRESATGQVFEPVVELGEGEELTSLTALEWAKYNGYDPKEKRYTTKN